MVKGQVVSGQFGEILVRQKSGEQIEIGELLFAESNNSHMILQVYDLVYGSQLTQQQLELISGMKLEENTDMEFMNAELRNYVLAKVKTLLTINDKGTHIPKQLPDFFSNVREVRKDDLGFITKPNDPLFLGKLRSGSHMIDIDVSLEGVKVLQHHILIAATTGRGKSNLVKSMLWNILDTDYCGILVLDPHDEYYGRNSFGLKNHSRRDKVVYYSKTPVTGGRSLKVNLKTIKPGHFNGAVNWSDAQTEALYAYYKKYGDEWIEAILLEKEIEHFMEGTTGVVRRRMMSLLDLYVRDGQIFSNGIFDTTSGFTTIKDIVNDLENTKVVVVDTSAFTGSSEILVGSLIVNEVFGRYKHHKLAGTLDKKPVISIVLEEAPRVLGKNVLEQGSNIFETIAREGRKFKIGLTAITQLPSLIPREILANMNTKIILGLEMGPERQAIIESASQDLSEDSRNIAALDKGEAIVTSNFSRFALPIKIPLFEESVKHPNQKPIQSYQKEYLGIQIV